jgi:hypothetical protein
MLLLLLFALTVQQPSRYAAPAPEPGTGVIKGRVIASDTGAPVRRAVVTVTAPGVTARTLLTDAEGRYEARNLAPGAYSVRASPNTNQGQFLHSNDTRKEVPLAHGQTLEWHDLVLVRAGAIVGRVVDEFGDPVSGVHIWGQRAEDPPGRNSMPSQSSDELGRYRIFRLAPGDYVILARPSPVPLDVNAAPTVGFLETYYPSARSRGDTVRITVGAGQDTTVGDLRLISGRLMRVRGVVTRSSLAPRDAPVMVSLSRDGGGVSRGVDADGTFTFERQTPGPYRLVARRLSTTRESVVEYASVPLVLADHDVQGIVLAMKPTVTLSGRVVFDGSPSPALSGALQVRAERLQRDWGSQLILTPAPVVEDLTFTLRDLAGELLLRPNGGIGGTWSLKAVLLGDQDITDVPREFNAEDSGRIQVVLTNRWSELAGSVTDDQGKPGIGRTVVLFSDDRSAWFAESSRMRATSVMRDGSFRMQGLRSGRYHLAVLPDGARWDFQQIDKALLEKLAVDQTLITIGEDERRQVELKLTAGG